MRFRAFTLRLPTWIEEVVPDPARAYPSVEERMGLVIELARQRGITVVQDVPREAAAAVLQEYAAAGGPIYNPAD